MSLILTHFTNSSVASNKFTSHTTLDIVLEFYVFSPMHFAIAVYW